MTTATDAPPPAEKRYTEADLLAMPDDGIRRWLVNGRFYDVDGMRIGGSRRLIIAPHWPTAIGASRE